MSTPSTGRAPFRTLSSLAWRESRSTRRRLLLYMSSISLGVAALVAIDSYAENVTRSVRNQSKSLFGGDVALSPRGAFTPAADSLIDSLAAAGATIARETSFGSMALAPRTGNTRLSQVRAVSPGFPLYGEVLTTPAGVWARLHDDRIAIVDPALLLALDAEVGDSLQVGYTSFVIAASLASVPGDVGFASTFGPRLYISQRFVADTRLLTFGSRADYDAFVRLPPGTNPNTWLDPLRVRFDSVSVRARSVSERENSVADSIDQLADFLGIVGLIALLLGGVGVASGINAWVARKIDIVAVLRCLGATSRQVMLIYATQAAAMGLLGAAVGAALGVGIQFGLPHLISDYLPVDVAASIEPVAIGWGMLLGVWIALAFALRPLIAIRRISPLQAIRRNVNPTVRRGTDWSLIAVNGFIAATVLAISATRSSSLEEVAAFSGGISVVVIALWISAVALSHGARRAMRAGWPYVVRQGVANLYRPANQTRAVVLALGFGAFLVSTLYLVQGNLLKQISLTEMNSRANLVLFDVQGDQINGVDSIVRNTAGVELLQRTPIVTMRVAAINGEAVRRRSNVPMAGVTEADSGSPPGERGQRQGAGGWAARREYRSTYRDSLTPTETLIAGKWFGEYKPGPGAPPEEVSLELSIADDLGVTLGDEITWDVQGAQVRTRITSLREVNWARFETNFYAVFPTATLEQAPQTFVVLAAAPEGSAVGTVQRDIVRRYPNVAGLDLSLVRKTISEISTRASVAIRFLTLFSMAMGIPVLFSAVAATRRERVREGVLLKTLGATRQQIGRILFSEYALLGFLGSMTGMVLSVGGAWAIMRWVFERPFEPALLAAASIALGMLAMAVGIAFLSGRDVFKETAMAALRE